MITITPTTYLLFNGNCAEAMRAYERVLGGKIEKLLTWAESPDCKNATDEDRNRIMHAWLTLPNGNLAASDDMSGQPYRGMSGFAVTLMYPTAPESKRVFDALADGGQVIMPLGKTFWSEAFGIVTDRFGTPWMISTEAGMQA